MQHGRTPDRSDRTNANGAKNRLSPQKSNKSLKDRYVHKGSPTRMTQEQQFSEAKRILDMHINYLSRGCYYFFRDSIARYDDNAMSLLRSYRHHESSDQLVTGLTQYFNSREATGPRRGAADSVSPVRTTSANVASQDRIRTSI